MWTTLWQQGCPLLQWGAVLGASLAGAATDLTARRIPNRLTGPVLLAGLAWSGWAGGLSGLCEAAIASILLAVPYVVLFLLAGGGAGDAKMMAAIGAWLGIVNGIVALAAIALCGIILAVACAAAKKRLGRVMDHTRAFVTGVVLMLLSRGRLKGEALFLPRTDTVQTVPYGVAIFVGAVVAALGVLLWRV